MDQKTLLTSVFAEIEPPRGLCALIFSRIDTARTRKARIAFISQTTLCFFSGMVLVPLVSSAAQEFYASGFYDYASLFFSADAGILSGTSRELAYSLIESIPAFALLSILAVTTVGLWSLRKMFTSSKTAFTFKAQTA